MPLIKCPECENEISDKVDTVCPKCGYKLDQKALTLIKAEKRTQKDWLWLFSIINILFFLILVCCVTVSGAKGHQVAILSFLFFLPIGLSVITSKFILPKNKVIIISVQILLGILLNIA